MEYRSLVQSTRLSIRGQTSAPRRLDPLVDAAAASVASLYVHVPFCCHKCHYCDFYSIVDSQDRQEAFTEALVADLNRQSRLATAPLDTIFVGGGTPTLLEPRLWSRLLDAMRRAFRIAPTTEFTVECNPETASRELFDVLAAGGVNRVSIGAQSFDPAHLETLQRWHDPDSVPRAIELASAAGITRRSVDLISAVPGQRLDDWLEDLDRALVLPIDHLSAYSLTYEPGTAMTARFERGEFEAADESLEIEMFLATVERARAAGLERYEVSNFARSGAECRHNLAYWRQDDWLAAGPSASAHVAGRRWKHQPNLREYLRGMDEHGAPPIIDFEDRDPARALAERLMTGIRLAEGIPAGDVLDRAGAVGRRDALLAAADRLRARGWLGGSDRRWALAPEGWLMADAAASELMAALD